MLVIYYYYHYYAVFNAPCVRHKDNKLHAITFWLSINQINLLANLTLCTL